jgi:hypothetical protein
MVGGVECPVAPPPPPLAPPCGFPANAGGRDRVGRGLLRKALVRCRCQYPPRPARPHSSGFSKPLFPSPSSPTSPPRCFRCLALDHCVADCRDHVRCRGCGRSRHRFPDCPRRLRRATSLSGLPLRGAGRPWSPPRPPTPYPRGVVLAGSPSSGTQALLAPPPPGFPVPFAHPAGAVPANSLHPPCPVLGLPPTQVPPALPPPPPSLRPLLRGKATPG